jgi:hypothetical protein
MNPAERTSRYERPDPRRLAVIGTVTDDLVDLTLQIRAQARTPHGDVYDALSELPAPVRLTVAQLAVAADRCGLRLVLGVQPR